MTIRRKILYAFIAISLSLSLGVASRFWPRTTDEKLVEKSIVELSTAFSANDPLKARVLFALPDVFTDAKLQELSNLIRSNQRVITENIYLGSVPGKIGDTPVLSSMFLLKFSDRTENILNVMSDLGSWTRSKPFVMSITLTDNTFAVRKAVSFFPTENGLRSYVLLFLGIAAMAVSTFAAYRAILLRPKFWVAWLAVSLFGVLRFRLNWATEDYDIDLMSLALPVFEIIKTSELSPFLFTFGVPVGAIAFLNHFNDLELKK